jgi:tetratricopeptide (TPR) repeat protein
MRENRIRWLTLLTPALTLALAQSGRAEPTAPIPQPARDRYDQGQALEKQGKIKEALSAYQEAIDQGMQLFPRAHLKEAGAYLQLKEYNTAIARYTKFIDGFGLEESCRY